MQPGQRIDQLHGLRGFAALAVVVQHGCEIVHKAGADIFDPLLEAINLGRFGVVLFFLVSGFVIPLSLRGETPLRDFAIGRLFRLYPAYWLSLPVLTAIIAAQNGEPTWRDVLANLTMIQGFWGGQNIGPGYWTLSYEMAFYILCAALFRARLLGDAGLNGALVLGLLGIAMAQFAGSGFTSEVPFFFAVFFLGMLLRRACVERCAIAAAWCRAAVPLTMLAGLVMGGAFFAVPANAANAHFTPFALAAAMVLPVPVFLLALRRAPPPPGWVMYLGTVSYSAYLFQDVGLYLVPFAIPPAAWPLASLLAILAVTVLLASLVHRVVERPMIALGRRLVRGEPSARPVPAPA
jgi:peptidoglycan/LPS O-acetylase OafA/YrhL